VTFWVPWARETFYLITYHKKSWKDWPFRRENEEYVETLDFVQEISLQIWTNEARKYPRLVIWLVKTTVKLNRFT
jgi:hypothetical protein